MSAGMVERCKVMHITYHQLVKDPSNDKGNSLRQALGDSVPIHSSRSSAAMTLDVQQGQSSSEHMGQAWLSNAAGMDEDGMDEDAMEEEEASSASFHHDTA